VKRLRSRPQPQQLKEALKNLRQALEETETALLGLEETFLEEDGHMRDLRSEGAKTSSPYLRSARC
jgi:hypothetical protein